MNLALPPGNVKIVAQDHMTFLLVVNTLREVLRVEIEALVEVARRWETGCINILLEWSSMWDMVGLPQTLSPCSVSKATTALMEASNHS